MLDLPHAIHRAVWPFLLRPGCCLRGKSCISVPPSSLYAAGCAVCLQPRWWCYNSGRSVGMPMLQVLHRLCCCSGSVLKARAINFIPSPSMRLGSMADVCGVRSKTVVARDCQTFLPSQVCLLCAAQLSCTTGRQTCACACLAHVCCTVVAPRFGLLLLCVAGSTQSSAGVVCSWFYVCFSVIAR